MIRLVVTLFLLACVAHGSEPRDRVEFAELGEDATSSFYYFFYSDPADNSINRVRIVWNGGAQNDPTIMDFKIDGDNIGLVESSATRTQLASLLKGNKTDGKVVRRASYDLSSPNHPSTKEYRRDLRHLFHALSLVRQPFNK
jgi:hypothetical protein